MRIELTALKSRVARNIFALFVISALFPLSLLAVLSYGYVANLLTNEGEKARHETAKSYALSLVERLQLAEAEVISMSSPLCIADFHNANSTHYTLGSIELSGGEGASALPPLAQAQKLHLAAGRTLVSTVRSANGSVKVLIARAQDSTSSRYLVGEIKADFLWGDESTRPENFCVLDEKNTPLICSGLPEAALTQVIARSSASGEYVWENGESRLSVRFWEIFLEPQFFTRQWTVALAQPETDTLAPIRKFRWIFALVVIAALVIVMLLSVTQIRRSLVPLERLIAGTRRLSENDFSTRVTVSTRDEFADLANSFNAMATRLGRQFSTLAAMSEIDRHILAALDVEQVVKIVLSRAYDVVPCDLICLVRFESGVKRPGFFYLSTERSRDSAMQYELTLSEDEIQGLISRPHSQVWNEGDPVPSYLVPLAKHKAKRSLVLPIMLKEGLCAVMSIGYLKDSTLGQEDVARARDFADRVAVALSNAAWEEKLYYRAHYDVLTDLPNRLLLRDRLQHALSRAQRNGDQAAVLFIDMDRFKSLNDSLGHPAGDQYLRQVARDLTAAVRAEDTVARLGGDEFVVVIADLPGKEDPVPVTTAVADKILSVVSKPCMLNGHEVSLSASIGIAVYPRDGDKADDLLKNADSAMYHAKEGGKSSYRFYSPRLTLEALERLELENDLRRAVERGELELYYQPRVDLTRQHIVGVEALVRWNHPREGLLGPAKFIGLAEETGLILPIGDWVLRTACSQLKAWQAMGLHDLRMAVNISALQVRSPQLIERILQTLTDAKLDGRFLELELTESIMMEDVRRTVSFIGDLSDRGIKLAVDDFGTGYSSLNYLKMFSIHILKIDQSFVRDIATSKQDQAIVKAIITLARSLNIATVGEGVETREQLQCLTDLGCDEFQGYLFSKPIPAVEFTKMMSGRIPKLAPALL